MNKLEIVGGKPLNGEIDLHGAKNSALPILCSVILIKGVSIIHNCPDLSDVNNTLDILKSLGCKIKRSNDTVEIDSSIISSNAIEEDVMRCMRSSILFFGALLSRAGCASIYLPGGCDIGARPIDLHIKALKNMGVQIDEIGSEIKGSCKGINGAKIILPFPSVGATENIIIAAAVSKGRTTIINPAKEPEIIDLANFLNKCGAKIFFAGESTIEIEGVSELHPAEHIIISDRILASTYMSACAITGGKILINKVNHIHINPVLPVFYEMGCKLNLYNNQLLIEAPKKLKKVKIIKTMAYPGFPTDSQAVVAAALTVARGTSIIKENIFENRFRYVNELNRFGSDIQINDQMAIINGVKELKGANVYATDLRGGAALVIAALNSNEKSTINSICHIDRGYEKIEENLTKLGADIKRISYEKE